VLWSVIRMIVESCPLTKLNGGLSRLHSADEDAVSWLTSYGSWNAYEKKKIRLLRVSLAQTDKEKTEKYAKLAEKYANLGKAAKFRILHDIGGSNPVPTSRLWSGSGSKINQFIHVPTSVDMQHFIQIHARKRTRACGQK